MSRKEAVLAAVLLASCSDATGTGRQHGTSDGGSVGSGGDSAGGSAAGGNSAGGSSAGGRASGGSSPGGSSTGGRSAGGTTTADASTGGTHDDGSVDGGVDLCARYGPACCVPAIASVEHATTCVVDVLAASVGTTYEYAALEQKIASLPQDILLSFTDADVAWAASAAPPAARIELHLTPRASMLHGAALEGADSHPFRVSCNGSNLFVGVVYLIYGAAALRTPVLHVEREAGGDVVVRLGSSQGAWIGTLWGNEPEARERIDRPEFRAALCRRGALQELSPDAG